MPKLSPKREAWPVLEGLGSPTRGKVRDTYRLENGLLLVVATDGISIFDFVLDALVPMKGIILNAMNHFWLNYLAKLGFQSHFVAAGADIDQYLPGGLRGNVDLQSRAMVVKELEMAKFEFIFRGYLTGSGLTSYKESGEVCGNKLPVGLQDGDKLPCIIDTPTDKAEEGHDEHVSAEMVRKHYPEATYRMINIFQIASAYAGNRGIVLADTKFEIGKDGTLADEILTPDSSRFWPRSGWLESRKPAEGRRAPDSFDKQFVREDGIRLGIKKLDPKKPEDVEKAHALVLSGEVIARTTQIYRYIFWRLTGMTIEQYLRDVMKVAVPKASPKNVFAVCGSDTDLPLVQDVCSVYLAGDVHITIDIMSCHRNPDVVMEMARVAKSDLVICAGGKAFALPGVFDAWAHHFKNDVPVAGVALGEDDSKSLTAAYLSIDEIPGQPVVMDEISGMPYIGAEGLHNLLNRVISGELPPAKPRKERPARHQVWQNF